MHASSRSVALAAALALIAGCQRSDDPPRATATTGARDAGAGPRPGPNPIRPAPVKPPLPVAQPPADAESLTGLADAPAAVVRIKRLAPGTGRSPSKNDTVTLNFTGWRLDGETFLSTKARHRPIQQSLALLAPGFAAAVMTMKQGERAMIWVPPELGYLGPPTGTPETTVYEVELVGVEPAPAIPPDVDAPPPTATRTPSGLAMLTVKPGDGTTRVAAWDQVTYHYTAWDHTGRMFDSTEVRKRAKPTYVFREWPGIAEALTTMTRGERKRIWLGDGLLERLPGMPAGTLVYELELLEVKPMHPPPPVPPDVAAPPRDARKTAKGVFYKVLQPGTGTAHPGPADTVRVHYSGWTTNGRLFDSTVVRQEPAQFALGRVIAGWNDGLQVMTVGERTRFWIPVELAYDHEPGRPAGMLVFDVEMLAIIPQQAPGK